MEDDCQKFQVTSTSLIPQNYPFPLGISTTVCHATSSASLPSRKAVCVISTTFPHRSSPSSSAAVFSFPFSSATSPLLAAASHPLMCSAQIRDGPPRPVSPQIFYGGRDLVLRRYRVVYYRRLHRHQDGLPQGWHLAIQLSLLRRDPP